MMKKIHDPVGEYIPWSVKVKVDSEDLKRLKKMNWSVFGERFNEGDKK